MRLKPTTELMPSYKLILVQSDGKSWEDTWHPVSERKLVVENGPRVLLMSVKVFNISVSV